MNKPTSNLSPGINPELSTRQVAGDAFFWEAVRDLMQQPRFAHVQVEPPLEVLATAPETERQLDLGWATRKDLVAAAKEIRRDVSLRAIGDYWAAIGRVLGDGIVDYNGQPKKYVEDGSRVNLNILQTYLRNIEARLGGPDHGLNDAQLRTRLVDITPPRIGLGTLRVWKQMVDRRVAQLMSGHSEPGEDTV